MNRVHILGFEFPDPNQFERIGLKSKLALPCDYSINSLVFDEKIAECVVENTHRGGKTYVVVFEGGGTCEFWLKKNGTIDLMDSHGIDFSWAGNGDVLLSPHRPTSAPGSRSFWGREEEACDHSEEEGTDDV